MRGYLITGRGFHVGAGAFVLVAAAAATERAHKLDVVKTAGEFTLAKAKETQAFKVGELVGLADAPKGQAGLVEELGSNLKKDSPEAKLRRALIELEAAARAAEHKAAAEREAGEKARAAEQAKVAEAAQVALWTEEWKATEAARKEYPKLDDYVAARRKELAAQAAS